MEIYLIQAVFNLVLLQFSLQWQPGSEVEDFDLHRSISRRRKPTVDARMLERSVIQADL